MMTILQQIHIIISISVINTVIFSWSTSTKSQTSAFSINVNVGVPPRRRHIGGNIVSTTKVVLHRRHSYSNNVVVGDVPSPSISTIPMFPLYSIYDDWTSDAIVDTMYLDEENVRQCLDEFINSDYGQTMFGCHTKAASIGITGSIEFVELSGPEVTLSLQGQFWHRRETVLGKAAVWLNARIPEITDVVVSDIDDLQDYEDIIDDVSGEVLFRNDKRSLDFNGDRETMEYQGLDPDVRGPFPPGAMTAGSSMINPI